MQSDLSIEDKESLDTRNELPKYYARYVLLRCFDKHFSMIETTEKPPG